MLNYKLAKVFLGDIGKATLNKNCNKQYKKKNNIVIKDLWRRLYRRPLVGDLCHASAVLNKSEKFVTMFVCISFEGVR